MDRTVSQHDRRNPSEHLVKMIRKADPLSSREQYDLIVSLPNQEARDLLVTSNLRFVYRIANNYNHLDMHMDDKMMAGIEGLIEGIDRFQVGASNTVLTYCVHWIRQRINKYAELIPTIRIPSNVIRDVVVAKKAGGDDERVLERTELTPSRLETVHHAESIRIMSLDRIDPFDHTSLGEVIEDPDAVDPHENAEENQRNKKVREIVDRLEGKESDAIEMMYWEEKTLQDVGDHWENSREYARQVRNKAGEKLSVRLRRAGVV